MNWIAQWWPWIPPILLSGIFNLLVAYQKLYRDCRSPFFNPWLSFGFWFWVMVQLGLPALVFCFYGKISSKPTVDFSLYWTAILVGFFFTVFVNADADLGFTNFPVDKIYSFLTGLAYGKIASEQTGKLANFRADLREELLQNSTYLNEGLSYLKDYFQSDFAVNNPKEQSELIAQVARALAQSTDLEKANEAISLILRVRRKDCPQVCRRFSCSQKFLQDYFP
jgi:hypothetical protein